MTFPRGKRIVAIAAAFVIASGLGACSGTANSGNAVESLGVSYTEAEVTAATDQLEVIFGQDLDRVAIVSALSLAQPVFLVSEALGEPVSDEVKFELAAATLSQVGTAEFDSASYSSATIDILAFQSLVPSVEEAFQADETVYQQFELLIAAPNTVVNPRYAVSTTTEIQSTLPLGDVVREATSPPSSNG